MKAKDLRIGNFILFDNKIKEPQIIEINPRFFSSLANGRTEEELRAHKNEYLNGYWQGITLTHDWLLKFGFKQQEYAPHRGYFLENKYDLCISITQQGKYLPCWLERVLFPGGTEFFRTIDYVHQLQNLYFALKGEELTIT